MIDGGALIDAIRGGSPPTWSISTEWFFYFAYPLIAWLILRARAPAIILLVVGLWCVLWTSFSTGLYDHSPQIDAWAVAVSAPLPGCKTMRIRSCDGYCMYRPICASASSCLAP